MHSLDTDSNQNENECSAFMTLYDTSDYYKAMGLHNLEETAQGVFKIGRL
jgi:hypothetical protein